MLNYNRGKDSYKNWLVSDMDFNPSHLGKTESIMALGNGYIGIRSSNEEAYVEQIRNTFISGTFNKSTEEEVTELPNSPDVIGMRFYVDGKRFSLQWGQVTDYEKTLNMKTGELKRSFTWTCEGKRLHFEFKRFVSLSNKHLLASLVTVKTEHDVSFDVTSGIDGQITNTGAMHFTDGVKRIYDHTILNYLTKTTESNVEMCVNTAHTFKLNGILDMDKPRMEMDRRKATVRKLIEMKAGDELVIEKISTYHTSRDLDYKIDESLDNHALNQFKHLFKAGYELELNKSIEEWDKYWSDVAIEIISENSYDQLSIRFAQYHLRIMAPIHDERMGIAAKGLTGEGYKGHSFWDTEIFIMPYFTYTKPEYARQLLKYRYLGLDGARRKATENGYEGAMYPWEAAWSTDGEVTPVWGAVDIVSGKSTKIWSGFIEQHITADVIFALYQYYQVTDDEAFMEDYGYEMILDTAIFWSSRLDWDEPKQMYGIHNIIGPDEYKEHVNNNAFTNYMAKWTMELALEYGEKLEKKKNEVFNRIDRKIGFSRKRDSIKSRLSKMYIPVANENGIIPQDDTYLEKEIIDLSNYKNQSHVGSIFHDYNLEQVNNIQVSKQADIMVLFYLREELFSKQTKIDNWDYYEPKTLHDSSLSLSTHSIIANDIHDRILSFDLFRRATEIDLGPNMKTSDHGIHAASQGGVWQCVVNGFGGVRLVNEHIRIQPYLPESWTSLSYPLSLKGSKLQITVTKEYLQIEKQDDQTLSVEVNGTMHEVKNKTTISI